jgi:2-oxo-4-hydroxy-4-carboxy-5-ureidoimidazoline decarboxylase
MSQMFTLESLNSLPLPAFSGAVGDVFEHAAWVADAAFGHRPFPTVAALHDAMMGVVRASPPERQLAFIRAHPELGSKVKRLDITADSQAEQGALGLDRLSDAENFARRLQNDADTERKAALDEIALITRLRLVARVDGPGKPKTEGRLSTHVLDNVSGKPAQGVAISLYEIGASARALLAEAVTNSDGRTDQPLIAGGPLRIGSYELHFAVASYFAGTRTAQSDPAFLDVVPIRFSIAEPEGHYHVPLLVTPWSYSTYRGS